MWFGLLGPLLVVGHSGEELAVAAARQRTLLAALLLHANRPVSHDLLADAVWDGAPPEGHAATLRSYVMRLRRALGCAAGARVVTRDPGYLIRLDDSELDVSRFEALCREADSALRAGAWAGASRAASEALALWRGVPLADVPSQVLRDAWLPRLEQLRVQAVEWRVEAELRLGHHEQLVPVVRELAAQYPLRENLHVALMRALAGAGQRAQALDAYQRARRVLVDDLGIEPGAELREVHRRILAGDLDPAPGRPVAVRGGRLVARQLPAAVRYFAGRARELKTLSGLLDAYGPARSAVVISAIGGTAGIGKTALAIHWAHQVVDRFPDGQLYVNLHGFDPGRAPMPAAEAIRGFLDALDVAPDRIPPTVDAQSALYRSLLAGKRVLVVLDNARDAEQVRPLLPGSPGCFVIVTSRNQLTGLVAADGAHPLRLDLLTTDEARQFLQQRLGKDRTAADTGPVDDIIHRCARLPLALAIVAARAATEPHLSLATLADKLRDSRSTLDAFDGGDAPTDLEAIFSWSYRQLSPAAARLFRLLGLHPGHDITAQAAASLAALPPAQVPILLTELVRASLLVEPVTGRYTCHDLLRAYAAGLAHGLDTEDDRRTATQRILDHYLHTAYAADRLLQPTRDPIAVAAPQAGVTPAPPTDAEQALNWFTAEHAVLLAAVDHAAATGFDTHAWQLAWTLADFLDRCGFWHDFAATGRTAVAAALRLGDPHAQVRAYLLLGHACTKLGHVDEAQIHLRHAAELCGRIGDRIGEAHVRFNLAQMLEQQGRHAEALDHTRQALDLYRSAGHRPGQAASLNCLGWLHAQLGDYPSALAACEQALELLKEIDDRDRQASTYDSLGYIHHHLGHHAEAVTCYRQALDTFHDSGDRYQEAATLNNLGDTHLAAGDPDAARDAWRQALTILSDLNHADAEQVGTKLAEFDTTRRIVGAGPCR